MPFTELLATHLQVLPVLQVDEVTNDGDVGEGGHLDISHRHGDLSDHDAVLPSAFGA